MDRSYRGSALVVLLLIIMWALVAFGPVNHAPANSIREQSSTAVINDPEAHIGEKVVVSGSVVETAPVRVRATASGVDELMLTGIDESALSTSDRIFAFGTLISGDTVAISRVNVDRPWEQTYVYIASLLGALIMLGRFVRDWRFVSRNVALVPRKQDSGNTDD